jgi:hypothetical protein
MRSIPRAGWAAHGFFGFAAKTFGNPSGATSGDGALIPPGPPAVTPVVWTFRAQPTSGGAPVYAMASDDSGRTILVDTSGAVQISTDGGHTWNGAGVISPFTIFTGSPRGMLVASDGVWILSGANSVGSAFLRSIDNGTTWIPITGVASALGTNGAGTWVSTPADAPLPPASYQISSTNGLTWASTGVTTIAGEYMLPILWNGTDFVLFSVDATTGTIPTIWTSPDAATWTGFPSNTSVENWGFALLAGGNYYVTDQQAANVYTGASVDALNNSPPIATNLTGGALLLGRTAAGQFFAFDTVGNVANTNPGSFTAWVLGTPNFSQPGESGNQLCFDAVNNSLIVGGTAGSICTVP